MRACKLAGIQPARIRRERAGHDNNIPLNLEKSDVDDDRLRYF